MTSCTNFTCSPSVFPIYDSGVTEQTIINPTGIMFKINCKEVVICQSVVK